MAVMSFIISLVDQRKLRATKTTVVATKKSND